MSEHERLIDDFYAAAWLPELWPRALDRVTAMADCYGAVLIAFNGSTTRWTGTELGLPVMEGFLAGGWEKENKRAVRGLALDHPGFLGDLDIFTPEEIEQEPVYTEYFRKLGLGWCMGTTILSPSGDLIVLNVERRFELGPLDSKLIRSFDPIRPHLARASLMSGRLRLERAQTAAKTLEAMGLPAAVVDSTGKVVAANGLFDSLEGRVIARAHGRVGLTDRAAARLLDDAVGQLHLNFDDMVRSIPVPATEDGPPLIVHLVPVRREAHDIFARAMGIMVVSPVTIGEPPSGTLLQGLFDLSPAEARVAKGIASGQTIDTMATSFDLSRETLRYQLKAVFAKTGTKRQADLAGLLAGKKGPVQR
jgi:DNA-binding CsgD family transcriptional regulator